MLGIITVASLKKDYQDYLQAQNSKINPYAPNDFWEVDAGASALQTLDLYMNLELVRNSIYPQNAAGDQVDEWIYSKDIAARGGLTYGTIQAKVINSGDGIIPEGDIFTDTPTINPAPLSFTNNQFQSLLTQQVSAQDIITLYTLNPGINILEPIGNRLSNLDGSKIIQVLSSTSGQQQESDQQAIQRILQVQRAPKAGARQTDYQDYAYKASSDVTNVITIPGFYIVNNVSLLGVFVMTGSNITEYQLNQGLLPSTSFIQYNRQAPPATITKVNNYIEDLKLVGLDVNIGTVNTKIVFNNSSSLNIQVALPTGYSLSTVITIISQDQNSNPITLNLTVENLVKREARRAICNQIGGTKINENLYLTMNSIENIINDNLSIDEGVIAKILTNVKITNTDIPGGIPAGNNIAYIFDISGYDAINVTEQTSY